MEYFPNFTDAVCSDELLEKFRVDTPWKQTTQKLWDKEYITPRLTCWYGDEEKIKGALDWTPELEKIRELVEPVAGIKFNTVLLNYYRDGSDSVA